MARLLDLARHLHMPMPRPLAKMVDLSYFKWTFTISDTHGAKILGCIHMTIQTAPTRTISVWNGSQAGKCVVHTCAPRGPCLSVVFSWTWKSSVESQITARESALSVTE